MQKAKNIMQRLKLRGSWGKLGTIPDGYYEWQANYTQTGAYYSFGNKVYNGLMTDRLGNFGLKWENSNT